MRFTSLRTATLAVSAGILALGSFTAPGAQAAPLQRFTADALATASLGSAPVPVRMIYREGQVRLELTTAGTAAAGAGSSVVLAGHGPYVYLLNPAQKLAFRINEAVIDQQTELPISQLLDLSGWHAVLQRDGKRIGHGTVAGEPCSLWRETLHHTTYRVWLSDRYGLPFRVESQASKGHPGFSFAIRHFTPSEALPASSFQVPAIYQVTELNVTQ